MALTQGVPEKSPEVPDTAYTHGLTLAVGVIDALHVAGAVTMSDIDQTAIQIYKELQAAHSPEIDKMQKAMEENWEMGIVDILAIAVGEGVESAQDAVTYMAEDLGVAAPIVPDVRGTETSGSQR